MVTYEMLTGLPPWYTTDKEKLFEALRSAPLKFPMSVNRTAALFIQVIGICCLFFLIMSNLSLFKALLNRNPLKRLGANGGQEVRSHPFFASIDWDALYRKEITPPFQPCRTTDESDTSNFEKEFTLLPINSVDETSRDAKQVFADQAETFLNFTYEEESHLEQLRDSLAAARRK